MKLFTTRIYVATTAVLLALTCVILKPALAADPTTKPTTAAIEAKRLAGVETVENYYAKLYGKPLKADKDARLAHLVAIISLSRIDGRSRTNCRMPGVGFAKQDPIVAQVAGEALHARATSLTADQKKEWLEVG